MSLRRRLLLGIIIGTAVLLAVFSLMIYTVTRGTMIRHFDKSLLATATMLSAVVENEGDEQDRKEEHNTVPVREIDFEFDVGMTPEFNNINGGAYYQFWSGGRSISRSPSLGEHDLPFFGASSSSPEYRLHMLPDGKKGRAVSYRFYPRGEGGDGGQEQLSEEGKLTLIVAREAGDLYGHLDFLRRLLIGLSLAIVLLSTGVGNLVTKTSLGPIHGLAKKIETIGEDNLGQYFCTEDFPAELGPICECLNDLFRRLEISFDRERRFNADVAHELRTPLAGIQTTIEVCLSRRRESEEYKESLGHCLQIVKTMNKMTNTLLSLSRLDCGQVSIQKESIGLKGTVDDCWRNFADKAYDKEVIFQNSIGEDLVFETDKDYLDMIISNVLDNAAEYTDRGGRIWAKAEQSGNTVLLSISNTGCLLSEEEVEHVFDFFWREDKSRTDTGAHCGIGLAVVRKICDVLGIEVKAGIEKEGIFSVCLDLRACNV